MDNALMTMFICLTAKAHQDNLKTIRSSKTHICDHALN